MVTEIKNWSGDVVVIVPDPCDHEQALPVESLGELVAWLCPNCDEQLPEYWRSLDGD